MIIALPNDTNGPLVFNLVSKAAMLHIPVSVDFYTKPHFLLTADTLYKYSMYVVVTATYAVITQNRTERDYTANNFVFCTFVSFFDNYLLQRIRRRVPTFLVDPVFLQPSAG